MNSYNRICRFLDGLYTAGGVVAALFLVAMLLLIVAQMLARWTGQVFGGAPDYAGYCMAAASFFAFAHALNRGAHVRVSLLLNVLGGYRYYLELWCFAIGSAAAMLSCMVCSEGNQLVLQVQRYQPGTGRHAIVDSANGHEYWCHTARVMFLR